MSSKQQQQQQQQRNWKTTQRKTRTPPNFAPRPISMGVGTTLNSIQESKESSVNGASSTSVSASASASASTSTNHSLQSSSVDSSSEKQQTMQATQTKKELEESKEQQQQQQQSTSTSTLPNNDIFQIIEEECYNGQLLQQEGEENNDNDNNSDKNENENEMSSYKKYEGIKSKTPPPIQAFQNMDSKIEDYDYDHNNDDNQVDYIQDDGDDDDDGAPIIYAHHDDDSISQITSSIAGNSLFSSDYMLSRFSNNHGLGSTKVSTTSHFNNSRSHFVGGGGIGVGGVGGVTKIRPFSHISNIPTPGLDGANGNNSSSNNGYGGGSKSEKSSATTSTPLMDDEELDKFFGASSSSAGASANDGANRVGDVDEEVGLERRGKGVKGQGDKLIDVNIYTTTTNNNKNNDSSNNPTHEQFYRKYSYDEEDVNDDDEDEDNLTLKDMYSIGGPSLSNGSGRRTMNTDSSRRNNNNNNNNSSASTIIAFIQQAKVKTKSTLFKAKHTVSRYLFNFNSSSNSNIHPKKDDDHTTAASTSATKDNDYFSLLMSPSFVSSPPNANLPYNRKKRENLVNVIWISSLLIIIWFLLYLAKVGNDAAWEKHRNKQRPGQGIPMPLETNTNLNLNLNALNNNDENMNNIQPMMAVNNNNNDGNILPTATDALDALNSNGDQLPPKQPLLPNVQQQQPLQPPNSNNNNGNPPPLPSNQSRPLPPNNPNAALNPPFAIDASDTSHYGLPLPEHFNNFLDINLKADHHVPFFWHVPRAAGSTIDEILGVCYHLHVATNAGAYQGHAGQDEILQLLDMGAGHSYVNVNVATSAGIQKAAAMGLVPSGLSDVVVSALINEAGQLFDPVNQGRIFTLLRHPVDRAVSLFYFLQDAQWRAQATYNQNLADISITDFYRQKMGESNWLVRYLTNQVTKPYIGESDLKLAKEILRRKILVGLTSNKEESIARFEKYFGWRLNNEADRECLNNKLEWEWSLKHPHNGNIEEGSELWNLIATHNHYDMQLYEYAKVLFAQQVTLLQ